MSLSMRNVLTAAFKSVKLYKLTYFYVILSKGGEDGTDYW